MVHVSRRRLLGVATVAVLGGCSGGDSPGTTTETWSVDSLPADVRQALGPAPRTVEDRSVRRLTMFRVDDGDNRSDIVDSIGLDPNQVDRIALVEYDGTPEGQYLSVVGSFEQDEPVLLTTDYRIYRENGRLIGTGIGEEEWGAAMDAVSDTIAAGETGTLLDASFGEVLDIVIDNQTVIGYPDYHPDNGANVPESVDHEDVETAALGLTRKETTVELALVLRFTSEDVASEETVEAILENAGPDVDDYEIEQDGRLWTASGSDSLGEATPDGNESASQRVGAQFPR